MKSSRSARLLVTVFFFGLLAVPLVLKRIGSQHETDTRSVNAQTALAHHGFYLQEVSHAAGINFVHQAPTLDPKLDRIMPEVASMGASVSIVDFDRDRKSTRLNSSHIQKSRMPSSA